MTRCGVPVELEYSLPARSSRHWRPRAEKGEAVSLDVDVPGGARPNSQLGSLKRLTLVRR